LTLKLDVCVAVGVPREVPSSGIVFLAEKIAVYSSAGGITGESNEKRLEDPFDENGAAALKDGFPNQPNCVSVESSVADVCPGVKSNIITELSLLRKRARNNKKKKKREDALQNLFGFADGAISCTKRSRNENPWNTHVHTSRLIRLDKRKERAEGC
jgi:hypothetical protein